MPSARWSQRTAGRRHWGDKAFGSKNSDSAGINRTHLGFYFPTQCSFFMLHDPVLFFIPCFLTYFVFSRLSSPAWTSVSTPLPSLRVCHSAPDLTTRAGAKVASDQVILSASWELTSSETGGGISRSSDTNLLHQNLFSLPEVGKKWNWWPKTVAQACLPAGPLWLQSHCFGGVGDSNIWPRVFHSILCTSVTLRIMHYKQNYQGLRFCFCSY